MALICALVALLLDRVLGEPRRCHPLVGFGRMAEFFEQHLNQSRRWSSALQRLAGCIGVLVLVAGPAWFGAVGQRWSNNLDPLLGMLFASLVLYGCIGWRSLADHASAIAAPLAAGNMNAARQAVSRLVSRDTDAMDETAIARAAVESVLENSSDALVASVFWFAVAGVPGVLMHRAANTLDAMWGYRTARFCHFGWAAARLDDVLNWAPARLTALAFVLIGRIRGDRGRAWRCWRSQAPVWDSPNAGPVMAAGAGALGVVLGGPARYRGDWKSRPQLGEGSPAGTGTIARALSLVQASVMLLLAGWGIGTLLTI